MKQHSKLPKWSNEKRSIENKIQQSITFERNNFVIIVIGDVCDCVVKEIENQKKNFINILNHDYFF